MSLEYKLAQRGVDLDRKNVRLSDGDLNVVGTTFGKVVPTSLVTAAGVLTLTIANLVKGYLLIDPTGADSTVTLPSAALIDAAFRQKTLNMSFECVIKNDADAEEFILLAAGAGITLAPTSIKLKQGEEVRLLFIRTATTPTYTVYALGLAGGTGGIDDKMVVSNVVTPGVATYSAAQLIGGYIRRDPTGASRIDLFTTAALLGAQMSSLAIGNTIYVYLKNIADAVETITLNSPVGTGITLTPAIVVLQPGESALFAVIVTAVTPTFTAYLLGKWYSEGHENGYVTVSSTPAANVTPSAASIINGRVLAIAPTANVELALPTGESIADALGADVYPGKGFRFFIKNTAPKSFTILVTDALAGVSLVSVSSAYIYPGQVKEFVAAMTAADTFVVTEVNSNLQALGGFVNYGAIPAAAVSDVVATEDLISEGVIALTAQPYVPRTLAIKVINGAAGSGVIAGGFTIVGVNANGEVITEVVAGFSVADSDNATKYTVNAFAVVTSVTASVWTGLDGGSNETVDVGSHTGIGVPTRVNGGMLINASLDFIDTVPEAPASLVEEYGIITPTTAPNGARLISFLYSFI